jgi:hypothetical protein
LVQTQGRAISHLSDNVDEWPRDPFQIIGVERPTERSDVRRAYSKLIREFRPETHPTHFQKLHEAYELVLAIVDGGGANILFPGSGPLFDFDNKPSVGSRGNAGSGSADEVTAETVWRQYSEAPGIDAFHAAKRLSESAGASAEVFLMLYWMLRLHPDIAPSEDRLPWLQRGLKRHPQDGRFVDLLTAELRADSLLCVDEQTRDIAAQIVRPDSLARYLSVRWDGIGRYSAWQQLDDEINQARALCDPAAVRGSHGNKAGSAGSDLPLD